MIKQEVTRWQSPGSRFFWRIGPSVVLALLLYLGLASRARTLLFDRDFSVKPGAGDAYIGSHLSNDPVQIALNPEPALKYRSDYPPFEPMVQNVPDIVPAPESPQPQTDVVENDEKPLSPEPIAMGQVYRPFMRQDQGVPATLVTMPRVVFEETNRWHEVTPPSFDRPLVLVARHIPESNYLVVLTQGYYTGIKSLLMDPKKAALYKPPKRRMHCKVGDVIYPAANIKAERNLSLLDDGFACQLNRDNLPKLGDRVTLILENGKELPSVARFVQQQRRNPEAYRYNICMYTQVRNQARYVRDWMDYHRRLGVDHFFINDNNSTDALTVQFKDDPDLDIIYWPWKKSQLQAYVYGRLALAPICRWVLFNDLDQFLYVNKSAYPTMTLSELVDAHENADLKVGELCINSRLWGSSGYKHTPFMPVPEAYVHRVSDFYTVAMYKGEPWEKLPNCMIKMDCADYNTWYSHIYGMLPSCHKIDVNRYTMHWNHYSIRSFEDFMKKFEGRNGVVRDWNSLSQWGVPEGHTDIEHPPKTWSVWAHGSILDTSFRTQWRTIMSNMSLPQHVRLVPIGNVPQF